MTREERRVVTVVFTDLVGFTERSEELDPEDVRSLLTTYYTNVRSIFEEHGGTVDKFIGDAVLAVFGAPVAHEDDPERAVRAALAVCAWAGTRSDVELRAGVNTGTAFVALEPSETGIGIVAGDIVNTASRIQSAAPIGAVLVGEATYEATRETFEYEARGEIEAKGKSEPIRVFEPLAARVAIGGGRRGGHGTLVGRTSELEALRSALATVRAEPESRLVLLVGEPGIGKTRLVAELEHDARATEGLTWLTGRSLPYGAGTSLVGLAEMVRAYAGIMETDDAAAAEAKLEAAVGALSANSSDARWVTSHLRPLVGLSGDLESRDDGRVDAFAAWRRFFELLASHAPLVLAFEDLHWAEDTVLDFLDELVAGSSPTRLLVVGTARPELLERRPAWGQNAPSRVLVRLDPLSPSETSELLHELANDLEIEVEVERALLERAAGNPLYAEEFVRMLAEGRRDPDAALPLSVQGIVAARLDALTPDEKAFLQDACVVGQVFWPGAVRSVSGDGDRVEELLDSLQRKEFVRRAPESTVAGEPQLVFRHPLIREVAYEQMPRARRAEKHQRAAAWAESLPADRAEARADLLADHYLRALEYTTAAGGDVGDLRARAAQALREAGDHARALHSLDVATARYERALELLDDEKERASVDLALAEAQLRTGNVDEAHRRLAAVAAFARSGEHAVLLARAALARGGVGVRVFDPDEELVALLEEALEALDAAEPALRARLLARLAIEVYYVDPPTYREELSEEAVGLAREAGEPDGLLDALTSRRVTLWSPDRLDDRLAVSRELVALAESTGDRERSLVARTWLVLDLVEGGDLDAARAEIDAYARLVEPLGIGAYSWWVPAWRAMLACLEGRFDDVRALADEAAEIGSRAGDTNAAIYQGLVRWVADAEQGRDAERWIPALEEGVARGGPSDAFRCGLAMQLALAGRHDDARVALAELGPAGFGAVVKDMNFYAGAGEFTIAVGILGDAAAARQAYDALRPYSGRMFVIARAAVCWGPADSFLGRLAATAGLVDDAERHFDDALIMCKRVGARPMAARTRWWYAQMLRTRGRPGDTERSAELAAAAEEEAATLGLALEPVSG
ncbi:MAG TPA: adenylate/guanylate cyclase domain-containing protein [Gaiellaceae bacterium]|nr:adenylate/guanylate cyclase domain-containing protein [Gaiellaceae bacterium]